MSGGNVIRRINGAHILHREPILFVNLRQKVANDYEDVDLVTPVSATPIMQGGMLGLATDPALKAIASTTNLKANLVWAAGNVAPLLYDTPLLTSFGKTNGVMEPDSPEGDLFIKCRGRMGGATDAAVKMNFDVYLNELAADKEVVVSNVFTDVYSVVSAKILAADIPDDIFALGIDFAPDAHATDDVQITAMWLEWEINYNTREVVA